MADISAPALEKAAAKLRQLVPSAHKVEVKVCDVSKESDIEAAVAHLESWGGIDIMFNNAGIMHADDADAIDTPEKIWDLTQAINVKGVWFGCKHAVISMRKNKKARGSIINTASVVALVGSATPQLAYTASKGAVLAMTRELAIVHAREGIRFNALCPAPLNTPLLQDWLGDDQPKRLRREIHFPSGRFGEAIEQAQAVLFLASDESSFVNGQVCFSFLILSIPIPLPFSKPRKPAYLTLTTGFCCRRWYDKSLRYSRRTTSRRSIQQRSSQRTS